MQPPLTQACPGAHAGPPSVSAQGGTQWVSTQTVPPRQLEAPDPVQGAGFTLHTPRVRSHWLPVGQGALAEQRGSHTPSTHAEPVTLHCEPSEQSCTCTVHCPSMHLAPWPPHVASSLQAPTIPPSEASPGVAESPVEPESPVDPESVLLESGLPPSSPGVPTLTHWATPLDSLQI